MDAHYSATFLQVVPNVARVKSCVSCWSPGQDLVHFCYICPSLLHCPTHIFAHISSPSLTLALDPSQLHA